MSNADEARDDVACIRAVGQFRELRENIFSTVPESCLLKTPIRNYLDLHMLCLTPRMLRSCFFRPADICALCRMDACDWNAKVKWRFWRLLKVKLLTYFFKKPEWMRIF